MNDYRVTLSSNGHTMSPINFSANTDDEAVGFAKTTLNFQRKSDPGGNSRIIRLQKIVVAEQTEDIKIN